MVKRQKDGLKGQLNRAQGIALGCRANKKSSAKKRFSGGYCCFGRKDENLNVCPKIMNYDSVRRKFYSLIIKLPRTVFSISFLPQGDALG